jgi:hypothetical protein
MIIRCDLRRQPAGRWKSPPMMIFEPALAGLAFWRGTAVSFGDQLLRARRHKAAQDADMVRAERGSAAVRLCGIVDLLAGRARAEERADRERASAVRVLTTEANSIVAPIHPKAMPDRMLDIVARGQKEDPPVEAVAV